MNTIVYIVWWSIVQKRMNPRPWCQMKYDTQRNQKLCSSRWRSRFMPLLGCGETKESIKPQIIIWLRWSVFGMWTHVVLSWIDCVCVRPCIPDVLLLSLVIMWHLALLPVVAVAVRLQRWSIIRSVTEYFSTFPTDWPLSVAADGAVAVMGGCRDCGYTIYWPVVGRAANTRCSVCALDAAIFIKIEGWWSRRSRWRDLPHVFARRWGDWILVPRSLSISCLLTGEMWLFVEDLHGLGYVSNSWQCLWMLLFPQLWRFVEQGCFKYSVIVFVCVFVYVYVSLEFTVVRFGLWRRNWEGRRRFSLFGICGLVLAAGLLDPKYSQHCTITCTTQQNSREISPKPTYVPWGFSDRYLQH